mmetsp:Transcript_1363/g.1989  ORF Transcript_1363/g.1989 Transcript_1363/m.1989 type:complete len:307 (+) Transcript_1363:155-1075(+)|eukprot:CAMPEP_0203677006 /NCGR_PEP_ID=MMETSP0090-20130426/26790_1 /ASSEMBLY_ACC=CAM_ASM_001088 /TAXON_ID=426623 /ORGANISM="Chaetoceros affinis, Strain CCMP159" /LENGTH=306 /DNA_ID=CAMNT_0050543769 /DNA_START=20 /DNA_END=940 /DNA_ORIENTATION=+
MADKCIICLEELKNNIGVISPCGHCFHRECFHALKKNRCDNDLSGDDSSSSKLPRCPVCKHKSKKFIDIYLTFEDPDESKDLNNSDSGSSGGQCGECSSSSYADATQALASLTSENMRLRKTLQEFKSVSKGQGELLLDVLPRFDDLQSKLAKVTQDKDKIEKELREVEEENSELLSGWNDMDMKMHMVKIEKDELEEKLLEMKRKNIDLDTKWNELDQKLVRAKKKRKLMESKQADELKNVKFEITKSQIENQELCAMLKKSQTKATNLKRLIKKLKRKERKQVDHSWAKFSGMKKKDKNCLFKV